MGFGVRLVAVVLLFVVLVLGFAFVGSAPQILPQPDSSQGSNWETTCQSADCQTIFYSYEKYWKNPLGNWEQIDENFHDCSENGVTRYCSGNYYYQAILDDNGDVSATVEGNNLVMRPSSFLVAQQIRDFSYDMTVHGSTIIYHEIIPHVDLHYQYLPHKLKEDIIIKEPLDNLTEDTVDLVFSRTGSAPFTFEPMYMCDSNNTCVNVDSTIGGSELEIHVPSSFLTNPATVYPITIDPTIELNFSKTAWDGYILNATNNVSISTYTRTSNPKTSLIAGDDVVPVGERGREDRAVIEWNISSVPDGSGIRNLTLSLYLSSNSLSPENVSFNITSLGGTHTTYADNSTECYGNCQFFADIGNGTAYLNNGNYTTLQISNVSLSSSAFSDFQSHLTDDIFSTGFVKVDTAIGPVYIASKDDPNATRRPKLIVNYKRDPDYPSIQFVTPTPANASNIAANSIYVNVSSSNNLSNHYTLVDFDRSLALWLRMDDVNNSGDPLDLSTYGINASKYGDATKLDGKFGDAFLLDGNGDSLQTSTPASSQTDNVTMSIWVNWTGSTGANEIIFYNGNTSISGFGLRLDSADGNQYEMIVGGVGFVETSDTLPTGQWTHLVAVRNAGTWSLYKNGNSVTIDSGSTLAPNTPTLRTLVGINNVGSAPFNGSVDEAIIFNRALSQQEVRALYNASTYPYSNNFTGLSLGVHTFRGFAVDTSGDRNQTEQRTVTLRQAVQYNLTYDGNGNLIRGFDQILEYDSFNHLTGVRNASGSLIANYFYDHQGNRIKKVEYLATSNITTYYVDSDFVMVVNSSGTYNTTYYHANNELIAKKENDGKKYFYHPDHLGSTDVITNQSGDLVEKTSYLPYGEVTEGGNDRFLFTGKEGDKESGLYYYGARYYNPEFNHFIQPDSAIADPYNPQDLNHYSYVNNNPYKYTDPSGNIPILAPALIGAGAGATIGFASVAIQTYLSTGHANWGAARDTAIAMGVGGFVAGLTFGIGGTIIGATSISSLSTGTVITLDALGGAAGGASGQVSLNALEGNPLGSNVGKSTVLGAALGAGTSAASRGISNLIGSMSKSVMPTVSLSNLPIEARTAVQQIREGGQLSHLNPHTYQNNPVNGKFLLPVNPDPYYYTTYYTSAGKANDMRIITGKNGETYYTSHYKEGSVSHVEDTNGQS